MKDSSSLTRILPKIKNLLCLFPLFFLGGCGYQLAQNKNLSFSRVEIPYIKGDQDGLFTSTFISALCDSGRMIYSPENPEAIIAVKILSDQTHHIGYKYDREEITAILIKRLEPTEGKRVIKIEVEIKDPKKGELLYDPFIVEASTYYDFVDRDSVIDQSFINPATGLRTAVLDFSLGQLDSEEGAQDISRYPLFRKLSQKILESLFLYQISSRSNSVYSCSKTQFER